MKYFKYPFHLLKLKRNKEIFRHWYNFLEYLITYYVNYVESEVTTFQKLYFHVMLLEI